ncbi:terpenoid synthase [Trametes meyenii]|nr:terpenoid synthase [Trametes meyenii]
MSHPAQLFGMPFDLPSSSPATSPTVYSASHVAGEWTRSSNSHPSKSTPSDGTDYGRLSSTSSDKVVQQREMIKHLIVDFLSRSDFRATECPPDIQLRQKLATEIQPWAAQVNPRMLDKMLDTSCAYAETAFGHTSFEHRYYIAIYTACMLYGEDLGEHDPEAVTQFARRLVRGQKQLSPIFDRLAELLQQAHLYWSDVGADAIITGTVDALTATAIEFATTGTRVAQSALRYPYYLRTRAGGGPQYTHFIFMRSWREKADSYLQILPEIEHWTLGTNDIISFYKEELAGETSNYVHLRADAEGISHWEVLRDLTEEVLDTARRIDEITAKDPELCALWNRYLQCYLEFSVRTPRYRLAELGLA